ncbi:TMEM175 family protein [Pelomonas sp. SE-A7]|uniref:TMEM175 family protein n=1 Tax=Pelomonas sp. SE-A7 TaxID=3054953 RepID=UPI00259D1348|nr:TMEM175 family protein [Pelomonas sp. SE-A7]MDM4765214.1 TMEM175 family protein [Pelomonas sp. SE-A7]
MSKPSFRIHRSRLETLVDGVFAIAMTILVLEVKVPELSDRHSAEELLHALMHHGYVIGAYFFSFAMLGLFWVWHHRLAEQVREIDLPVLVCALSFLALVCFFPFASALLGRYTINLTALLVYVPVIGLIVLLQTLFYWTAMRRGLVTVEPATARRTHQANLIGLAVFCFASTPTLMRLNVYASLIGLALGGLLIWRAKRPVAAA